LNGGVYYLTSNFKSAQNGTEQNWESEARSEKREERSYHLKGSKKIGKRQVRGREVLEMQKIFNHLKDAKAKLDDSRSSSGSAYPADAAAAPGMLLSFQFPSSLPPRPHFPQFACPTLSLSLSLIFYFSYTSKSRRESWGSSTPPPTPTTTRSNRTGDNARPGREHAVAWGGAEYECGADS
jgi:hypothetical protein